MKTLGQLIRALEILEENYPGGALVSCGREFVYLKGQGPLDPADLLSVRGCRFFDLPPAQSRELMAMGLRFLAPRRDHPDGAWGAWAFPDPEAMARLVAAAHQSGLLQ